MAITTTTTGDSTIPELWSALTVDDREENLVIFNMYDRRFEEEAGAKAYDTIHIQGIGNYASGATTLGVGGTLSYEAGVFNAQINLAIDTHAYHAFDLETEAEMLSNISHMEKLAHKSGYALSLKMDDDAAGMIDDFGTNIVGSLVTGLEEADVRTAMRMLNDAIAPESGRYAVISPYQHEYFMGIEKFVNSLYKEAITGVSTNGKYRGFIGTRYGADWYVSGNVEGTNAAGHDNGMFQKEAVAVAVFDQMRTKTFYNIDTDSTKFAVHALYGLKEIRDNHGCFMRGL